MNTKILALLLLSAPLLAQAECRQVNGDYSCDPLFDDLNNAGGMALAGSAGLVVGEQAAAAQDRTRNKIFPEQARLIERKKIEIKVEKTLLDSAEKERVSLSLKQKRLLLSGRQTEAKIVDQMINTVEKNIENTKRNIASLESHLGDLEKKFAKQKNSLSPMGRDRVTGKIVASPELNGKLASLQKLKIIGRLTGLGFGAAAGYTAGSVLMENINQIKPEFKIQRMPTSEEINSVAGALSAQ